jgi:hypothetical protein
MYQAVQLLVMIVVLFIYFKVVEATWLTCIRAVRGWLIDMTVLDL